MTGAAGFIGFHLAQRLHSRGDAVLGFDNFNDYYIPALKRERARLLKKAGVEVVEGDLCHRKKLKEVLQEHQATHIVHLAAQAGVRYSLINPDAYVSANIEGFLNILESCRHGGQKLVYASSSSVYGTNAKIPFSVEDPTDQPASFYGATKKANEVMARSYHHLFGLSVTGLRFFTVYGPWGRPDMAYYSFAKDLVEGKPIHLFNHGKMRRDFTYIDDVVDGTVAALDLEAPCEIFNLGNHQPEQLSTFIQLLEKYLGRKGELILLPMQPGDVPETYADIEHSRIHLGFAPKTSLQDGLKKFVDWFIEHERLPL